MVMFMDRVVLSLMVLMIFVSNVSSDVVITATLTLTTPAGCGAFDNGYTVLSCSSTFTTARIMYNIYPATATATATSTHTVTMKSMAPVKTLTRTVSEVVPASKSATGFCFDGQKDILTPCTELLIPTASPKTNSAIRLKNPFQNVMEKIKSIGKKNHATADESPSRCPFDEMILIVGAATLVIEILLLYIVWGTKSAAYHSFYTAVMVPLTFSGLVVGFTYHFH